MTCGFTFKILFLDEDDHIVDIDRIDIEMEETAHPENDRDEAGVQADEWAENHLEDYAADDFETSLENAY